MQKSGNKTKSSKSNNSRKNNRVKDVDAMIEFEGGESLKNKKGLKRNIKIVTDIKLNEAQLEFSKLIQDNRITVCFGSAGTAKTFTTCYNAVNMLKNGEVDKIIITKPIQESSAGKLGFLPGDLNDKLAPYEESFINIFEEIIGKAETFSLRLQGVIQFKPLNYMRGSTYKDSFVYVDEAQNCTREELMLVTTRLSTNTKIIITGDVNQHDIKKNDSFLLKYTELFKDVEGLGVYRFDPKYIVRDPMLIKITTIYEDYKTKHNL